MLGLQVCITILAVEQFLKYLTDRPQRQQEVVTFYVLWKRSTLEIQQKHLLLPHTEMEP